MLYQLTVVSVSACMFAQKFQFQKIVDCGLGFQNDVASFGCINCSLTRRVAVGGSVGRLVVGGGGR